MAGESWERTSLLLFLLLDCQSRNCSLHGRYRRTGTGASMRPVGRNILSAVVARILRYLGVAIGLGGREMMRCEVDSVGGSQWLLFHLGARSPPAVLVSSGIQHPRTTPPGPPPVIPSISSKLLL